MLLGLGLSGVEIAVIVLVVILVFGPSKLPKLGEGIGKMLRGFRKEMKAIEDDKAKEKEAAEIDVTPTSPSDEHAG